MKIEISEQYIDNIFNKLSISLQIMTSNFLQQAQPECSDFIYKDTPQLLMDYSKLRQLGKEQLDPLDHGVYVEHYIGPAFDTISNGLEG